MTRRSAILLALILPALVGLAAVWSALPPATPKPRDIPAPVGPARPDPDVPPTPAAPVVPFRTSALRATLAAGAKWATPDDVADPASRDTRNRFGVGLVTADFDGDGRPDAFVPGGVVAGGAVRDVLMRNTPDGFIDVSAGWNLPATFATRGVTVVDYDGDGRPDLVLCGPAGVRLLRNDGGKTFADRTAAAKLDGVTDVLTATAADLDGDGRADLVLCSPTAGLAVCLGRPDGTFSRAMQLAGNCVGAVAMDLDGDGSTDLVALSDGKSVRAFFNDGKGTFRGEDLPGDGHAWTGGLLLDLKRKGVSQPVLFAADHHPILPRLGDPPLPFVPTPTTPFKQAFAMDANLDGWTDVVGLTAFGSLTVFHNTGKQVWPERAALHGANLPPSLEGIAPLVDASAVPGVLLWSAAGLHALTPAGIKSRGVVAAPAGLGAVHTLKAGTYRASLEDATLSAGVNQSRVPLLLGLGDREKADDVIRRPVHGGGR